MNFEDDPMMDKDYSLICKYKNGSNVDKKVVNFSILKTIGEVLEINMWKLVKFSEN